MIEEVISFSRAYINFVNERTPERKEKIRIVYRELTGEKIRTSCGTCYIKALLIINKRLNMEPCKYRLKEGHRVMCRNSWSKIMTNKNITNGLAEWHLKNNPKCIVHFERVPGMEPLPGRGFRIVPPVIAKTEPVITKIESEVKFDAILIDEAIAESLKVKPEKKKGLPPKKKVTPPGNKNK